MGLLISMVWVMTFGLILSSNGGLFVILKIGGIEVVEATTKTSTKVVQAIVKEVNKKIDNIIYLDEYKKNKYRQKKLLFSVYRRHK